MNIIESVKTIRLSFSVSSSEQAFIISPKKYGWAKEQALLMINAIDAYTNVEYSSLANINSQQIV